MNFILYALYFARETQVNARAHCTALKVVIVANTGNRTLINDIGSKSRSVDSTAVSCFRNMLYGTCESIFWVLKVPLSY